MISNNVNSRRSNNVGSHRRVLGELSSNSQHGSTKRKHSIVTNKEPKSSSVLQPQKKPLYRSKPSLLSESPFYSKRPPLSHNKAKTTLSLHSNPKTQRGTRVLVRKSNALPTSSVRSIIKANRSTTRVLLPKFSVKPTLPIFKAHPTSSVPSSLKANKSTRVLLPKTSTESIQEVVDLITPKPTARIDPTEKTVDLLTPDASGLHPGLNDPDYVEDMYKSFRDTEMVVPDYMPKHHPEVNTHVRREWVDFLVKITQHTNPEVCFLVVDILDRFLAMRRVRLSSLPVTAVAALLIAIKYDQNGYIPVERFIRKLGYDFSVNDLLDRETIILKQLGYRITFPSPHSFLVRYRHVAGTDEAASDLALAFLKQTLSSYELRCQYKPSQLAAAAVLLAQQHCSAPTTASPAWTIGLEVCTQYASQEVEEIARAVMESDSFSLPKEYAASHSTSIKTVKSDADMFRRCEPFPAMKVTKIDF